MKTARIYDIMWIMNNYCIFECAGDVALNILGTAVVQSLKKSYSDRNIIVLTHFPEAWLHNPNVFRVYKFGAMSYFYDDYIKDKNTIVFRHNPYLSEAYAYGKKHLIHIWCELCGVEWDKSLPSLHFTWREKEAARKLTASDKPLFLIETHGNQPLPNVPALWARDMPLSLAEKVVEAMKKEGYRPISVNRGDQQNVALWNTEVMNFDLRQTLCALQLSTARFFINSYALQAAAAFKLPSTAFFVSMEPDLTSYDFNKHILPNKSVATADEAAFLSVFKDSYELSPVTYQSPYDLEHLYDIDQIIEKILETAKSITV